ncbi:hypothetical protein ACFQ6Q_00595 [Streptomyces sp. NPDC056437]|uniref:hypothetical protein n=1 Tax=Streptomyces sp. NPDC056437 TaxID=3345816 RepID=UPI00369646AF
MDLNRSPYTIAEAAAEEIRALNHVTLGKKPFNQPADVYSVTDSLVTLIDRMPQVLKQLGQSVQTLQDAQAIRMDDGSDPVLRVAEALGGLADAQRGLLTVSEALRRAKSPLAGMGGYLADDEGDDDV